MANHHVNPKTGEVNICRATKKPCRFGIENHFDSKQEAEEHFGSLHSQNTVLTKPAKTGEIIEGLRTSGAYGENIYQLESKKRWSQNEKKMLGEYNKLAEEISAHGEAMPDTVSKISGYHFAKEMLTDDERLMLQDMEALARDKTLKTPLVRVYHGSPKKFESFDYSEIGANGTSEGQGFYFTDSQDVASFYGEKGYMYAVDFHGSKAISIDERTISRSEFKDILKTLHHSGSDYLSNWGDVDDEGEELVLERATEGSYYDGPGSNDVDNIGGVLNAAEGSSKSVYRTLYEKYGYDHIPAKPDWGSEGQTVYVATVPEAFTVRDISEWEGK